MDRLLARTAVLPGTANLRTWLRGETRLPIWQLALTAALILLASIAVPTMSLHRAPQTAVEGGGAPIIADSLPADPRIPSVSSLVQTDSVTDIAPDQQIAGLHDSSQELLKQIQQAQHDNAALRQQLQSQDQYLGSVQTEAAANSAEQTTQQQEMQNQTTAAIQNATTQLSQLQSSVKTLDDQAAQLRKVLGMGTKTYPAVTLPDLTTAADPAQAFDSALSSFQTHIAAVSDDLQTIKSTAKSELVYATSNSGVGQAVVSGAGSNAQGSGVLIWPTSGTITQPYGPTSLTLEPAYGGYDHFHLGIDIANAQGTPIAAAAAGTVIYAGWTDAGYGNMVEIDHGNGLVTLYGHMMTTPSVTVGQKVFQGQLIGYMGTTGNSTGPHCHFAVQKNGSWENPANYLP